MLEALWGFVRPAGTLLVELAEGGFSSAARSLLDKLVDYRYDVPAKLARLLRRHAHWHSGDGLHALGGATLLNPMSADSAVTTLRAVDASFVDIHRTSGDTSLLIARAPG
jgi:hypothetical protein